MSSLVLDEFQEFFITLTTLVALQRKNEGRLTRNFHRVLYMYAVINYGTLLLDLITKVNPLITNWKSNEGASNVLGIDVTFKLTSSKY